jgi:hypothetical protein
METPGTSFQDLIDKWNKVFLKEEKNKEQKHSKVKNAIDGQNIIMFFKKGDGIFGAPEESRLVFAQLKNPDGEMPDDASFPAFDLIKGMNGSSSQSMFSTNDLPKIEIITRDNAERALMQCPEKEMEEMPTMNLMPMKTDKYGANSIKLKDRE